MIATCTRWFASRISGRQLRPGTREHARRRLRQRVCATLLCLGILLALLLSRVYTHMRREVFFQYRTAAEEVVERLNQRLAEVLQAEESRPFDEYSFLNITANPLLQGTAVTTSPLSTLPPRSTVPGLLGYFQMNPDGRIHSPVLPALDDTELAANAERFGFGSAELEKRLALRRQLEQLLLSGAPMTTSTRRRQQLITEPASPMGPAEVRPQQEGRAAFGDGEAASAATETDAVAGLRDTLPSADRPGAATESLAGKKAPQPPAAAAKSSAYRERRKEQVALPEQSTTAQVQGALERLNTLPPSAGERMRSSDTAATPAPLTLPPQAQPGVKILTFEGEVDPFQCTILPGDRLLFFRKAWRNNLRYIQGFIVDHNTFFQPLVAASVGDNTIGPWATLTVQYQDRPFLTLFPPHSEAPTPATVWPLYRASLDTPLDTIEMVFRVARMPRGAGATLVDLLALALGLVMVVGHYGLYRVGIQHIELAAQHSDFVAAVSHELKTPLTSIRMYGEMLRAGWVTDEPQRQSYYDFIFFESERLSRLIANVLQLARLTNHNAALELQEYSLCQLLDLIRSKVSTQADAAGFTLQLIVPDDLQEAAADSVLAEADAVAQIFINLVDNAIKFAAQAVPQRIDVGVRRLPGRPPQAVFFVRDYGPGIAREQLPHIFQRFYRGENELTRHTKGTGIGLALVNELAVMMHARVEVENCHPGAEFRLLLPVVSRAPVAQS